MYNCIVSRSSVTIHYWISDRWMDCFALARRPPKNENILYLCAPSILSPVASYQPHTGCWKCCVCVVHQRNIRGANDDQVQSNRIFNAEFFFLIKKSYIIAFSVFFSSFHLAIYPTRSRCDILIAAGPNGTTNTQQGARVKSASEWKKKVSETIFPLLLSHFCSHLHP